jgi:hypothetical protein
MGRRKVGGIAGVKNAIEKRERQNDCSARATVCSVNNLISRGCSHCPTAGIQPTLQGRQATEESGQQCDLICNRS